VKEVSRETPIRNRRSAGADRLSPVAALVRRHDRDRFQTALFAPAARREALLALYAFNYEIARVRESVTEPTLGRIRLQWWRESIAAAYEGGPVRHHPVVEPLSEIIRGLALARDHFDRMIDARETDLEDDPPASLAKLEEYAEGSSSQLVYLALEALGVHDPAAFDAGLHIGIAYSLAGLLRAMPFRARQIIPADIAPQQGIVQLAAAASRHLATARNHRKLTPRAALPALLPAAVARHWLIRLKRVGFDPFNPAVASPDPLQTWRLGAAALLNRF